MLIDTSEKENMKIKYYPDADALVLRLLDEKPDHGEQVGEEMILHYTKDNKLVKIEILDASRTVIDFLQPILSQKPVKAARATANTEDINAMTGQLSTPFHYLL